MTRETRIGMLIGLLFIFAFGLVLSELNGRPPESATVLEAGADGIAAPQPHNLVPGVHHRIAREQPPQPQPNNPPPQADGQRYVIRDGDSLIGIARHFYGPDNDAAWMYIYQYNRQRIPNPDRLPVGTEILIPDLPAGAQPQPEPQPAYVEYKIRSGDTLTSIARRMLNDDSQRAIQKIYDANVDRLPNPDRLPVGTIIRIPRN